MEVNEMTEFILKTVCFNELQLFFIKMLYKSLKIDSLVVHKLFFKELCVFWEGNKEHQLCDRHFE